MKGLGVLVAILAYMVMANVYGEGDAKKEPKQAKEDAKPNKDTVANEGKNKVSMIFIVKQALQVNGLEKSTSLMVHNRKQISQILAMFPKCLDRPESKENPCKCVRFAYVFFVLNNGKTVMIDTTSHRWRAKGDSGFETKGDFPALVKELEERTEND